MTFWVYSALCLLLGLAALALVWGSIDGARQRQWKFAGGCLLLALILAGGSSNMYECSHGRCVGEDPSVPRLR